MKLTCSTGVMAYNEERKIGQLLGALVSQRTSQVTISEILVVTSGCTDRTESIVRDWMARDPRIQLLVQAKREGKASAVNAFLRQARERIVVLCSADLIPEPDTIERVLLP